MINNNHDLIHAYSCLVGFLSCLCQLPLIGARNSAHMYKVSWMLRICSYWENNYESSKKEVPSRNVITSAHYPPTTLLNKGWALDVSTGFKAMQSCARTIGMGNNQYIFMKDLRRYTCILKANINLKKHRGSPKTFPYILEVEVHPPGKEG